VQDEEFWAAQFEEHRPRLRAVAYRMLGSFAEAEDAVQEAWLRVSRASGEDVENVGGWLTTIVSRQCLNMLRSRVTRREDPLDVRVPDPVVESGDGVDPAEQGVLAVLGHESRRDAVDHARLQHEVAPPTARGALERRDRERGPWELGNVDPVLVQLRVGG